MKRNSLIIHKTNPAESSDPAEVFIVTNDQVLSMTVENRVARVVTRLHRIEIECLQGIDVIAMISALDRFWIGRNGVELLNSEAKSTIISIKKRSLFQRIFNTDIE